MGTNLNPVPAAIHYQWRQSTSALTELTSQQHCLARSPDFSPSTLIKKLFIENHSDAVLQFRFSILPLAEPKTTSQIDDVNSITCEASHINSMIKRMIKRMMKRTNRVLIIHHTLRRFPCYPCHLISICCHSNKRNASTTSIWINLDSTASMNSCG